MCTEDKDEDEVAGDDGNDDVTGSRHHWVVVSLLLLHAVVMQISMGTACPDRASGDRCWY